MCSYPLGFDLRSKSLIIGGIRVLRDHEHNRTATIPFLLKNKIAALHASRSVPELLQKNHQFCAGALTRSQATSFPASVTHS